MDRLDRLTDRLLADLEREAADHPVTGSEAHLDACLACLDRSVELRDAVHGIGAPAPVSPRLVRALDRLQGGTPVEAVGRPLVERARRILGFRVPAWTVAGIAAVLMVLTWTASEQRHRPDVGAPWPLPDPTRPDRLDPANRQGSRTVTGVVSSIRDATSDGVRAHVLSLKDAGGSTYVLFTWGSPTVGPGDAVEVEALFTGAAEGTGRAVYQGVVTELRRAR